MPIFGRSLENRYNRMLSQLGKLDTRIQRAATSKKDSGRRYWALVDKRSEKVRSIRQFATDSHIPEAVVATDLQDTYSRR